LKSNLWMSKSAWKVKTASHLILTLFNLPTKLCQWKKSFCQKCTRSCKIQNRNQQPREDFNQCSKHLLVRSELQGDVPNVNLVGHLKWEQTKVTQQQTRQLQLALTEKADLKMLEMQQSKLMKQHRTWVTCWLLWTPTLRDSTSKSKQARAKRCQPPENHWPSVQLSNYSSNNKSSSNFYRIRLVLNS
jgi:hypothetical protein